MSHRLLPWPHNLTPAQRRTIEAIRTHGTYKAAAAALGISPGTVDMHLGTARMRARVTTTAALVERYEEAKAHGQDR